MAALNFAGKPRLKFALHVLWLLPVLLYDLLRRGRPHRVYVIGLLLNLPLAIASHFVAGSIWRLAISPRLVGIRW